MKQYNDVVYPYRPIEKQIDDTKTIIRSNYRECSFIDGDVTTTCYKVDEEHYGAVEYMDKMANEIMEMREKVNMQEDVINTLMIEILPNLMS